MTSSHSITSPPINTATQELNLCLISKGSDFTNLPAALLPDGVTVAPGEWDVWGNCEYHEAIASDAANIATGLGLFEPTRYPYNTTLSPSNILPPNPSVASYCGELWSSSASSFWGTNPLTSYTDTAYESYSPNGVGYGSSTTDVYHGYSEIFDWKATATQCCLNCTIIGGGTITVQVWPTPAISNATALVDVANNFT